jgi:hypothetical protein
VFGKTCLVVKTESDRFQLARSYAEKSVTA